MNEILQDRIRGCAVGAAVGDAFGMPLEFKPKPDAGELIREMTDGRLPAGTFTDDTEMALALADILVTMQPFDPTDLAERFVQWYKSDPPDIGNQTRAALSRMAEGEPWDEAVEAVMRRSSEQAGNGSLMRCWPVALARWDNLDDLLVDSWQQSRVTHPHPDCLAACAFLNTVISHILRGTEPGWALILASSLVRMDDDMWRMIETAPYRSRDELDNTGWVRHTLESAVWAITTTDSFEEAVIQAANLGGDADTAACVTGALAGAAYGLSAIPEAWQTQLQGEWPPGSNVTTDDLITIADKLGESA